jgi:hypothetical protein
LISQSATIVHSRNCPNKIGGGSNYYEQVINWKGDKAQQKPILNFIINFFYFRRLVLVSFKYWSNENLYIYTDDSFKLLYGFYNSIYTSMGSRISLWKKFRVGIWMDGRGFVPVRTASPFPHGENQPNLHVPLFPGLQSSMHTQLAESWMPCWYRGEKFAWKWWENFNTNLIEADEPRRYVSQQYCVSL